MISEVKPLPTDSTGKMRVIERLEELLLQARKGTINGIAYVIEEEGAFGWGKCNMSYPTVLGALTRAIYHVNKEWDAAIFGKPPPPAA